MSETGFKAFERLRHLLYIAILVSFAVVIHTVEAALPLPMPVPGVRIGLANIITLLALLFFGLRSALIVAILRTLLGSLFVGGIFGFGFWLSFSAGITSCLVMALVLILERKSIVSLLTVSVSGAVVHNLTQLAIAAAIIGSTALLRGYYPLLLLLAVPTGLFTGAATHYLEEALERFHFSAIRGGER